MSFIVKLFEDLPPFIQRSKHCNSLKDLVSVTASTGPIEFSIPEEVYIDTLEITQIKRIINADLFFGFHFDDLVEILRNIYKFSQSSTERLVVEDPKASFFAGQIHILLTEKKDHVIMVCMKLNYPELLVMAMQENFPRMDYWLPGYSDMYYAATNTNPDCFRLGLKYGFPIDRFTVGQLARRGNPEMLELLISSGEGRYPKSSKACEEAETIETIEFFLRHGFKMFYTTITNAALKGNFPKMQYAIDHGCEIPKDVVESATESGNIDCLKLAIRHSPVRTAQIMNYIIEIDNLEAFNLALELGFPVNTNSLKTVTKSKCVNITTELIQRYL